MKYCEHPFRYKRRPTREVRVGAVGIGGGNPIRIQSMTTSPTLDTASTVQQIIDLAKAGCEIVRVTVPSVKEAENLKNIRDALKRERIHVPIVADIHFTPNAALKAAEYVEKIRINPGNFADKKKFSVYEYSETEYQRELERIESAFRPLVLRCKERGVAMRIGVNHGSLSDRIMSRFGDTPAGMVASAIEFVQICERHGYRQLVLSMKASNTQVMIAAYRLLAAKMYELGMDYPFHLGVTEAGDGDEGRVKSAVGIGALLEDGLGDTIRVSLTEDSVREIPAARALSAKYNALNTMPEFIPADLDIQDVRSPFDYERRKTYAVTIGNVTAGDNHPVCVGLGCNGNNVNEVFDRMIINKNFLRQPAEIVYFNLSDISETISPLKMRQSPAIGVLSDTVLNDNAFAYPVHLVVVDVIEIIKSGHRSSTLGQIIKSVSIQNNAALEIHIDLRTMQDDRESIQGMNAGLDFYRDCFSYKTNQIIFSIRHPAVVTWNRILNALLREHNIEAPMMLKYYAEDYDRKSILTLYHASSVLGSLLCDGIGDGILIDDDSMTPEDRIRLSYTILQATRRRITKTEFITCPSCGRTQFNLQEVTARIKEKTSHLRNVKIAVMGCIVNGLGEMADADFGYIGAGPGRVNLYVGKNLIERNIDMHIADQKLIELIRSRGLWTDPD